MALILIFENELFKLESNLNTGEIFDQTLARLFTKITTWN